MVGAALCILLNQEGTVWVLSGAERYTYSGRQCHKCENKETGLTFTRVGMIDSFALRKGGR